MDINQDPESYWNRSASKAFSFDDDDEDVEEDNASLHSSRTEHIFTDDNISEASFDNTANILNLTIRSVLCEADLELILNEQSLDSDIIPKGIAPDEELKLLRRKLQNMVHVPSLKVTATKLLHGKLCPLEVYKSLNDKEELLDEVLRNGDGNAVVGVILFLQRTLNKKQFYRILRNRPKASDHYINYLIQTKNKEAIEILTMLGRHQESAIVQFKAAINGHSDILIKEQKLKQFIVAYSSDPGIIPVFHQIFTNSLNLIQFIDKTKTSFDDEINVDSSVLEVLYSCSSRHKWKDLDTTSPLSPFKIAADYQISPAQFEWTALNERAKSQSYLDLGGIFEKSSWNLITKQKQFHISFSLETAIQRLADLNAPLPVLYFFLSKLSNPNQKLVLSKKVKCTKGIIDALVALKDVQVLENFKETLINGSEERFYCEQALTNVNKKWSTEGLKIIR
ncbi:vacuolar protein sorting-associated protein 16B [Episyrphus balteatus]|uniref:vacuolar protein sorting-associated protein 16B n=1 Tax=Episyrphus balteatus TaxID=286459 RepID=UPI00248588DE|nr:vacuolar protein sorting-associated protein 16B [Episyrphus balteatus]XP_055843145.1 vacuolar protein sorting-associated protein 16B [Episyrphus balteatus]